MGVIIYGFNLNISPKMSYAVLECDVVVTESPVYDFVIKKRGCYLWWTLYKLHESKNLEQFLVQRSSLKIQDSVWEKNQSLFHKPFQTFNLWAFNLYFSWCCLECVCCNGLNITMLQISGLI